MDYERIINEAKNEAIKASKRAIPTPMVVGLGSVFSNEIIPGTQETVSEGVCGFAWIKISGRGGFAKYVRDNQIGSKGVYGGVQIWASALDDYIGQSMERKVAAMHAASKVFTNHGIKNTVYSRMD